MRYPFRSVAGTPAQQPVNIGITMLSVPPVSLGIAMLPTPPPVVACPLPTILSASFPAATVGSSYSHTITGAGDGVLTYLAADLPPGLVIDSATGDIVGTPSAVGAFFAKIAVANMCGVAYLDPGPSIVVNPISVNWRNWNTNGADGDFAEILLKDGELFDPLSFFMFAQGGDQRVKTFSPYGDVVGADCVALAVAFDLYDSAATLEVVIGAFDGSATYGAILSGALADIGAGAGPPPVTVSNIADGLRVELDFRDRRAVYTTATGFIGTLSFDITKNGTSIGTLTADVIVCS